MPLPILYQDEWLVAVDKPAGMLVHAGRDPEPPDQIAMKVLRDQLVTFIYTIHRLDRPTSGVLLFAVDVMAQKAMTELFRQGGVCKKYLALVNGIPPEEGLIDIPLKNNEDSVDEEAKECQTRFRRISSFSAADSEGARSFSIVETELLTGRIHQIRKHLKHLGHPIVGDYLYGDIADNDRAAKMLGLARMMLMSHSLSFTHPFTEAQVDIKAELPPEFLRFAPAGL